MTSWLLALLACTSRFEDVPAWSLQEPTRPPLPFASMDELEFGPVPLDCKDGRVAGTGQQAFSRIQDAIDVAVEGETVWVCPGVHTERLRVDKALTLAGWSERTHDAVLDGGGVRRVLAISEDVSVGLWGLTFQDGDAVYGGAVETAGDLYVEDCHFVGNRASRTGGALWVAGTATVVGSTFLDNAAFEGGAIYAPSVVVESSVFEFNLAEQEGGAVRSLVALDVQGSRFVDNLAGRYGGAVSLPPTPQSGLRISGSSFGDNRAHIAGGAVVGRNLALAELVVETTLFEHSSASYEGGALYLESDGEVTLEMRNSRVATSVATKPGAGIKLDGAGRIQALFDNVVFDGNQAEQGSALAASRRLEQALVVLSGGRLSRNQGAAVRITDGVQLASLGVDWGAGDADNDPLDLMTDAESQRWSGEVYAWCDEDGHCEDW